MQTIGWQGALSGTAKRVTLAGIALRNVILGGNFAAARFVAEPRKLVSYVSECLFLFRLANPQGGLPQVPVWEGLHLPTDAGDLGIRMYADAAEEWFRRAASFGVDLVSLCAMCRILQPKVIFEIGTLYGSAALHLAGNSPDAEVYSLDLGPSEQPLLSTTLVDDDHVRLHSQARRYHFTGRPEERRIHCLQGDSAKFDFEPWTRKVDLFFIDGAHSYDYVRNDTLKALLCCHPGSIVAWHDYGRVGLNGVSKWLHEFRDQGREIYRVPGGSLAYARI
jgi:predicted O-methyltransferase YrrM